jgi:hypothetical protein
MRKWTIILFVSLLSKLAFADCNALGKQGQDLSRELDAATQQYQSLANAAASSSDRSSVYAKAIAANNKLLSTLQDYVALLERGQSDGCFGQQSAAWASVLKILRSKQGEFKAENETLVKAATFVQSDRNNKTTQGKTSSEFIAEKLDEQFEAMNKIAPIEVDSNLFLSHAERRNKVITYTYGTRTSKGSWTPAVRQRVVSNEIQSTCEKKELRLLLSLGYEFLFTHFSEDGLLASSALVTLKACEELTISGFRASRAK